MTDHRPVGSTYFGQIVRIIAGIAFFSLVSGCGGGTVSPSDPSSPGTPNSPTNQPPTALLSGPTAGFVNQPITFSDGGSSDPDGDLLTYAWSFGDGAVGTNVTTTHTYTAVGVFTITLTVSDPSGATATATTTATITTQPPGNFPPSASMNGPYMATTGQEISMSALGSMDPNGDPLTYAWSFGDGGTGAGGSTTHMYAAVGVFTVTLTVTDGHGGSDNATTTATISPTQPGNQPPTAHAGGPYAGTVGQTLSFDASASTDPNSGDVLTYAWSFGDGTTGSAATTAHIYTAVGAFTVTLTVTDGHGGSDKEITTATISAPPPVNLAPSASVDGPYVATTGQTIPMSAVGSIDPNGDPLTYAWNFGDGTTATDASVTHTYGAVGTYTVRVTVTDPSGLSHSATTTATINAAPVANQLPVITSMMMPTPSTVVAGQSITVTATASDDDGDAITFSWNFGDGSSSTPASLSASATHTYTNIGSYVVTLTVSDGRGGTDSQQSSIAVTTAPVNHPPVAHAGGPYPGTVGEALSFDASASTDPNGDPLTFAWNFGDGTTGATMTTTHAYAGAATYAVTVTVTDPAGLSNSATTTATISPLANRLPVITNMMMPTPSTVVAGQSITVTATASDDDGDAITFSWNFGDGSSSTPASLSASATHTYTNIGSYVVTLTVSDGRGNPVSDTRNLTVSPPTNRAPVANAGGPAAGIVGQTLSFDASASTDPDGNPLTFAWSFGDGATGTGMSVAHAYGAVGTYTVRVSVTDPGGLSSSATTTATISVPANRPPVAHAGGPYAGAVGEVLTVNAVGSSDPDNDPLTYAWNFGDGTTGTTMTTTHAYAGAATYTVTVTVTDPSGASHSATTTAAISVPNPGNSPPTVSVTVPSGGLVLENMILRGTGSDPDNDTLTYSWNFGDGTSTAFGSTASIVHEYAQAGTYVATLTASDGQGHTVSASSGTIAITLPARPVAFAQTPLIFRRTDNIGAYVYRVAIELDGAGVPPLRFNIVAYPTHWASDAQSLHVALNQVYQWWDPIATPPRWRPECFSTISVPASCRAPMATQVDPATGALIMTPSAAPPTVSYLPERCWVWIGLSDSFSFTVTDGNGITSDPAVVAITLRNSACHPPSF